MDEAEAAAGWSARRRAVLLSRRPYDRPARLSAGAAQEPRDDAAWAPSGEGRRRHGRSLFAARRNQDACPLTRRWSRRRSRRGLNAISTCIGRFSFGENVFVIAQTTMPLSEGETSIHPEVDAVWVSEVGTQIEQAALAHRIVKHTQGGFRPQRLAASVSRLRRDLDRPRQSQAHRRCFSRSRPRGAQDDRKALQSRAEPRSVPPPRSDDRASAREPLNADRKR